MLTQKQKISFLDRYLTEKPYSYGDGFKIEIHFFFNEFEESNPLFSFLTELNSLAEIERWVDRLIGRIIMHETDDLIGEIIADYFYNG